jgi:uncharacterized protein (DUF2225 family)
MIDIGWLVEHGPCKKYYAGTAIPCPGGSGSSQRAMYILLAGRVDVLKKSAAGGTQVVASLLKGDIFGGREYFADADDCTYIAGIDSAVYVINEESFNDLSWSRPEILFEILKAAYIPMKKMTAASAKAAAPAGTAAPAKATVPEAAAPEVPAVPAESKAATAVLVPATLSGLFPEGHKSYSGITRPEYSALVFPKEYKCPYCKASFKDFRVFRSKLYECSPMRYDLRKYFTDFQTEWYDILTCRNCYFSTFHNYFTDPKPVQKAKIDKELLSARAEVIMDFDAERDIDFVFTAHYLAILCADGYPSMGKQIRAKLWGNLSWLYEDVEDEDMEKLAAGKAAEAYEQVYSESRLTPIQEQITCLSIAGMQRRAGVDRNLKKFLFTAKTLTAGDKTYAKLAEEFMYELKIDD